MNTNNPKKQIIIIHGGDSFNTYEEYLSFLKNWEVTIDSFRPKIDWKTNFQNSLGDDFDVLLPRMPNKQNARYAEWKIWFEKMFSFLDDEVTLIGHSLGAMFIIKYLAENHFPHRIKSMHLVAPPHNRTADIGDFKIPVSLKQVEAQVKNIYIYYSKDDPVVSFSELDEYKRQLLGAHSFVFPNRAHFNQPEFPELIELITRN